MAKSILVNTIFIDLGDIILLCIILWTLCRRSTTFDARKPKVSKANGIKACWLSEHDFSCLTTLLDSAFRAACPTVKAPTPKLTSGETPSQVHTCMFSSNPFVHHNICRPKCRSSILWVSQKVHRRLLLHRYSRPPEFITKSCLYLKSGSSLQWTTCSPKVSRHALRQTGHTSSIEK